MKRFSNLLLIVSLLLALIVLPAPLAAQTDAAGDPMPALIGDSINGAAKIEVGLRSALAALSPGAHTTVIVTLQTQTSLVSAAAVNRSAAQQTAIVNLRTTAATSQAALQSLLQQRYIEGAVSQATPFWIFNGFSVTATPAVIAELAARPDVATISADALDIVPAGVAVTAEPNLAAINAPALWALGWAGQGVVVANLDTGVDISHPDLAARWRDGGNSWFDPYGQHPFTPFDADGHGTWTMGVMVGDSAGGTGIGVAPQARWIAARVFNDKRESTATAIHLAFQWLLDPDGNPNTADAPHVVNNSWTMGTPGCNLAFELDLQALRAAGVIPVFAAGNAGPTGASSRSPANNPSALAVGATSNTNLLYANSSRGPSACGEANRIYPEVSAPGIAIRTSDIGGGYFASTGTSLAAPHVAGGLAVLLSAFPNLSVSQQEAALTNSALDLGAVGPDNDFGYGRIDLQSAYQWLLDSGITPQTGAAIIVNTTSDALVDDAACSLREAILSANRDTAVGGCATGGGGDTIIFDPMLSRPALFTLALAGANEDGALTGDLDISGTLTVDGMAGVVGASPTGSEIVIDGGGIDRVLDLAGGAHVTLLGITVRNGLAPIADDGGGIRSSGELTMRNATIVANQGGGLRNDSGSVVLSKVDVISNTGGYGIANLNQAVLSVAEGQLHHNQGGGLLNLLSTATLTGASIVNNGGSGIHNEGATLSRVTLSLTSILSNTAGNGGGLLNQGVGAVAAVSNSRFAYNMATSGGGIFNNGSMTVAGSAIDHNQAVAGAGVHQFGGSLAVINSTISHNSASDNGGGLYNRASTTTTFVTFNQNSAAGAGGNLFNDEASVALGSTILANAEAGGNCTNSAGYVHSTGYNIDSGDTCLLRGAGDFVNTDALLGELKDNSGPTPTHALRLDSSAIDRTPSGANGCGAQVMNDQRGIMRPVNANCDAGAYEATTSLGDITPIHAIQGASHASPMPGAVVTTRGIVTAIGANGFYLQYATPDADAATSEGIFVITAVAPTVAVGDDLLVLGKVSEVMPGGALSYDLTVTTLTNASVTLIVSGNSLPAPIVLGQSGRALPATVIEDDALATFDPVADGLDFFESLESMRVLINNALVVGPGTAADDFWVLVDGGAAANPRTERSGVYALADDANPERVRLNASLYDGLGPWPSVDVGATVATPVVGVVDYAGAAYAIRVTQPLTVVTSTQVAPEITPLTGDGIYRTVATLEVGNLGGQASDDAFATQATLIVQNLRAPDILLLDEVADNSGAIDDAVTAADVTFSRLIMAVQGAGGPTYRYEQIDPFDAEDGGELGANARLGIFYNPLRVQFAGNPGDAAADNSVRCVAGKASLALNPGRIGVADGNFLDSRKPLAAQFTVDGERLFVIGVHFDDKASDTPEFGATQPPVLNSASRRLAQARIVNGFVQQILACEAAAKVVVMGNPNDDLFSQATMALQGASLSSLMNLLPASARYSAVNAGNSRVTSQALVSQSLAMNAPAFDVVHVHAEFAGATVPNDPVVAKVALTDAPRFGLYLPMVAKIGG